MSKIKKEVTIRTLPVTRMRKAPFAREDVLVEILYKKPKFSSKFCPNEDDFLFFEKKVLYTWWIYKAK